MAITTLVWLAATWLTPPTDASTLRTFYTLARPAGPGWTEVRRQCGGPGAVGGLRAPAFIGWVAGCAFVYSALFGAGFVLMGRLPQAAVAGTILVASGIVMWRAVARLWAE